MICVTVCVCLLCQPAVSWWKCIADSAISRLPPWHLRPQASVRPPSLPPSTSPLPPAVPTLSQFSAAQLRWPLVCPWQPTATSLFSHAALLGSLLLISKLKTSHCLTLHSLSHAFSEASQSETTSTETNVLLEWSLLLFLNHKVLCDIIPFLMLHNLMTFEVRHSTRTHTHKHVFNDSVVEVVCNKHSTFFKAVIAFFFYSVHNPTVSYCKRGS